MVTPIGHLTDGDGISLADAAGEVPATGAPWL